MAPSTSLVASLLHASTSLFLLSQYPLMYWAFFYYSDSLRRHLPYTRPLFYHASLVGLQFIMFEVARDLLICRGGCVAVASGTWVTDFFHLAYWLIDHVAYPVCAH
jgi:hypothetical protein